MTLPTLNPAEAIQALRLAAEDNVDTPIAFAAEAKQILAATQTVGPDLSPDALIDAIMAKVVEAEHTAGPTQVATVTTSTLRAALAGWLIEYLKETLPELLPVYEAAEGSVDIVVTEEMGTDGEGVLLFEVVDHEDAGPGIIAGTSFDDPNAYPLPDRRIHALSKDGLTEIARYETRGKWFIEHFEPSDDVFVDRAYTSRELVPVAEAAKYAAKIVREGGTVWHGIPGGGNFDRQTMYLREKDVKQGAVA